MDKVAAENYWKELGIAAPARRALIGAKIFSISDLKKISAPALKELHGIGPNALKILEQSRKVHK